jgi:hypothetical protein
MTNMNNISTERMRKRLITIGIIVTILSLWNGVCDIIYGYSFQLSGSEYFTSKVFRVILSADGRSHNLLLMAQTAGWLYPVFALAFYMWWAGMHKAGFWLGKLPNILLAYAVLMIGGLQHAGWAFLSVLEQAKAVTGCTDSTFFNLANKYIVEHFLMGDLTAVIALYIGTILHAVGILSGKTIYPRWFIIFSPMGILTITMTLGYFLPAPYAGAVLAPFGTWFLMFPTLANTLWLRKNNTPKLAGNQL